MVLSKACTYGILASLHIARELDGKTGYVSIGRMSDNLRISFHFLTKILQQLTSAGILTSMKGPKGGVALKRDAEEITLLDIIIAIDGMKVFTECLLGMPGCGSEKPCPVHDEWAEIREDLYKTFQSRTLGETARRINELDLRIALPELYDS
ncbi:Rrf2 family transcriptional regulator [Balneolales bacterium ANBcel1]|nr:Rrf2 family transcriptional regulator [Balneolales bacterium ANBcel1]